MPGTKRSFVAVAGALAGFSHAQTSLSRTCPIPASGICYELNIPDATASSGTGDIFFSITAPTTFEWVSLGQGNRMANSNIFVVYTSADGQNVTVSSRPGTGHSEPKYSADAAQLEVLSGSGVSDGVITANVRCSNCNSWSGGTMDFSGESGSWIHAELAGTPLASDDLNADIGYHSEHGVFDWSFATAKGGNSANPFTASDVADTSGAVAAASSGFSKSGMIQTAHGVVAALAFVLFFPIGGILIKVANFPGLIWIHTAIQMLGYVLWIAAFGMGIWMATEFGYTDSSHAIIGYVVFALLVFQPVGGLLHHLTFKKTGGRSLWSYGHIFIGRTAIILGIANGGLGLKLADNGSSGAAIAYGVIGGFFGVVYLAAAAWGEYKRDSTPPVGSKQTSERGSSKGEIEYK